MLLVCDKDLDEISPSANLLFAKVYENFIEEIDGIDNGVNVASPATADGEVKLNYRVCTNISSRVGHLNPNWNEPTSEDIAFSRFEKAMQLVGSELEQRVLYYHNVWLPARSIVEKALDDRFQCHSSGDHDLANILFLYCMVN